MNIEASLPDIGQIVWRDQPAVQADVKRIVALWSELLLKYQGPMLFGDFCAAYAARVTALPAVQAWIKAALAENDFVAMVEPYRVKID